jgi:hypothetical protein
VANGDAGTVSVFLVGTGGALTAVGSPSAIGTDASSVAFSPSGLLGVADSGDDDVSVFSVSSGGALTAVAGSPYTTASDPLSVTFGAVGGLLATANGDANSVSVLSGAPAPVDLGTASTFAVLAGSTATSAGVSTLTGDLGVSPGAAVTGFPPGTISGTLDAADPAAVQGQADLATAYGDAVGRAPAVPIVGDLGGVTLTPGVYAAGAAQGLTGTLTLDAQGNPDAVFILQIGSALNTAADSDVDLANGAQACNVFWQVGSSATLGADSDFTGTILANTAITMGDGVTLDGRALAISAAVTMVNDTVTVEPCAPLLSNTVPAITPFSVKLTGLTQTVDTGVGAWSVTDATGSNAGYSVTAAASAPTVNGSTSAAGTGGSITLTPATATAASGNTATTGPVAASPQTLTSTPATIENAPAGTGQGEWDFAADAGTAGTGSLAIVIPGDASPGNYTSTLTFTTAPPAG